MKRFFNIPIISVILILVFSVFILFQPEKLAATQSQDNQAKKQAKYDQDFIDLVKNFEKKNIIENADKLITAYSYHAGYPGELIQNTISIFHQNPNAGLQIFAQLCLCFYSSGEASEAISEEVSILFFKDRENFLVGLAKGIKTENFNCLLDDIDYPTDISQALGFDYEIENKKIVDFLKKHRLKDNAQIIQLDRRSAGCRFDHSDYR